MKIEKQFFVDNEPVKVIVENLMKDGKLALVEKLNGARVYTSKLQDEREEEQSDEFYLE